MDGYKTYIFPILFFKRINDVYNEEFEKAMKTYADEKLANSAEQHRNTMYYVASLLTK